MVPTLEQIHAIVGKKTNSANTKSVLLALQAYHNVAGLDQPHRLAHYLSQIMHESMGFTYDREVWGPTPAQKRYEGRKDLGNTQPGDGAKFSGKGPIQVTGRGNVTKFYKWCIANGMNPPDFRKDPDLINTDPWEGLSAIWYWDVGNPTGKSLNRYADENNIIQITKKINGGLNGFDDRVRYYVRASLVFLGFKATDVKGFQAKHGLLVDGDPGPQTMTALHKSLAAMGGQSVPAGPIVEERTTTITETITEEVQVPVVPKGAEKTGGSWLAGVVTLLTTNIGTFFTTDFPTKVLILGVSVVAIGFMLWKGQVIAQRVKAMVKEFQT
jgi:putative chitinase